MLPHPVHHVLLAAALGVPLLRDPAALMLQFVDNELVRVGVIVIVSNLTYALVRLGQSFGKPPSSSIAA
jgi:hypothetical protein